VGKVGSGRKGLRQGDRGYDPEKGTGKQTGRGGKKKKGGWDNAEQSAQNVSQNKSASIEADHRHSSDPSQSGLKKGREQFARRKKAGKGREVDRKTTSFKKLRTIRCLRLGRENAGIS